MCDHSWIKKTLIWVEMVEVRYCLKCKKLERHYDGYDWSEPNSFSFPVSRVLDLLLNRPPEYNVLGPKKNV